MSGLGSTISHDPKKIASVATVDDLNNYPVGLRQWGLRVVVTDDNLVRELVYNANSTSLADNNNWLIEGSSITSPDNPNIFTREKSYAFGGSTGRSHPVIDVTLGPNNSIFHVEATVVVAADGNPRGGSLKIAGTFMKGGTDEVFQIGATQTIYPSQEDITGGLAAIFVPSAIGLQVETTTGENCITHVSCKVTSVSNSI